MLKCKIRKLQGKERGIIPPKSVMSGLLNPYLDIHFSEIIYDVQRYFRIVIDVATVAFVKAIVFALDIGKRLECNIKASVKKFKCVQNFHIFCSCMHRIQKFYVKTPTSLDLFGTLNFSRNYILPTMQCSK